jgi:hypothetical protein
MPIGSTLDVVIQQDDLVVLGPPSAIDVAVDIGPRGEPGTQLYTGALNPNNLTFQQFQDIYGDVPRIGDLFLRTDSGENYGSFYQFTNVPGNDQWEVVVDLIDVFALFLDLNPNYLILPKSGGTGINNGTKTITVGGNFRTLGNFPLDLGLSGSTSLFLPTSGSVAVRQDKLNVFAATTSAELASVITNETGTGALVFATSPTLTTPNIGVATGTSFNSITGLSSTNPTMNGTVAVGTGTTVARADHVHPIDTSRAPLASPTFTGVPAAPTAAAGTNTTQIATTAFVTTAGNLKANLSGATFTGEVLGISPTSSAAFTTKAYVDDSIGAVNLPSQTGNQGKYLSTSGSAAFWSEIIIPPSTIIEKTSAHTLELSDAQKIIEVNSASAVNITIPADSSVNFPIGSNIDIVQTGSGQVTIDGEGGVTLLSKDSNTKTTAQYSGATIYKKSTNTWVIIGDLSS